MPHLSRDQHRLLERFAAALGNEALTAQRLVIAVSGGSDSMALLELAALARGNRAASDTAVYVDHGLRRESTAESEHVRAASQRLGTEFAALPLHVNGRDERRLRDARYAELQKLVAVRGAAFLLTGHTRDDQIETVLHRLVRGAGRHGLAGIPERRENVLRPLLGFGRTELRDFLRSQCVGWREDASNEDLRYVRNRLRRRIIPMIEAELGPGALDHLPALAAAWREEEAYLDAEAARYAEFARTGASHARRLESRGLNTAPAALRTRIVRAWLAERTGRPAASFSRDDSLAILALAGTTTGTKRLSLAELEVINAYGELDVGPPAEAAKQETLSFRFEIATGADSRVEGPGGWVIEVTNLPRAGGEKAGSALRGRAVDSRDFDRCRLAETLIVRPCRMGDRMRSSGRGQRKVSDLFVDARVPLHERQGWPVVETGDYVVWVPGIASDAEFAASAGDSPRVRMCWHRELVYSPCPRLRSVLGSLCVSSVKTRGCKETARADGISEKLVAA